MQDASESEEPQAHDHDGIDAEAQSFEVDGTGSTVLVEVAPGVVAVYGDVPSDLDLDPLKLDFLDLSLSPGLEPEMISTTLATIGHAATVAGNFATSQGLFRLSSESAQLLKAGGRLAAKDGASLGTIIRGGGGLAQARFIPVSALPKLATSIGPALAMIALQMTLNQLSELARTNMALTGQVLTEIRSAQWSELSGLVTRIQKTLDWAREAGCVTENLWFSVAASAADLEGKRALYRGRVADHVEKLAHLDGANRRQYLQINADALVFDTYALMASLKAWVGYQAIHAARERAAGDPGGPEARVADAIARAARTELQLALEEATTLVDSLTRELQLIAELPGRSTVVGTRRRRDAKDTRQIGVTLLKAIQPMARTLLPPLGEPSEPSLVCLPESVDYAPYLHVLGLVLDRDETLRAIALVGSAREGSTFIAITDRRFIASERRGFLQTGELALEIPTGEILHPRRALKGDREQINFIHGDMDHWLSFPSGTRTTKVRSLVALLAEPTVVDSEAQAVEP